MNLIVDAECKDMTLSSSERERLEDCEVRIQRGLDTFMDVGLALLEIRDARLYRAQFDTFESYCRERWGMGRQYPNKLIQAAEVAQNLTPIGVIPKTESQARPLAKLEPEVQREVWSEVVASTPPEKITAKVIDERAQAAAPLNQAVREIKQAIQPPTAPPPQAPLLQPEPAPVAPIDPVIEQAAVQVQQHDVPVIEAARAVVEKTAHNHRAQGTGENEWYTPAEYLDAARAVLGDIDLDPATSPLANETVGAARIFTAEDNGLDQPWAGKVWLNPPYSQPAISQFSEKLASEWEAGNIESAIALTHNYTDTGWFHRMASACNAICFTRGRIGFVNPEGKKAAPTQGQAFFYFGNDVETFVNQFGNIGFVVEVRQ